jgi:hypothetical protein
LSRDSALRGAGVVTFMPLSCRLRTKSDKEAVMAKVSWNRTWSIKMRKKSRCKKGKNRFGKKK